MKFLNFLRGLICPKSLREITTKAGYAPAIMRLRLDRVASNEVSTAGDFYINGLPVCHTIEDAYHAEKIDGKTRVWQGVYSLIFNRASTPLTTKYGKRFPRWFLFHLMLENVFKFTSIYLHMGNRASESSGCILLNTYYELIDGEYVGYGSAAAYTAVYNIISRHLRNGGQVELEIRDLDR